MDKLVIPSLICSTFSSASSVFCCGRFSVVICMEVESYELGDFVTGWQVGNDSCDIQFQDFAEEMQYTQEPLSTHSSEVNSYKYSSVANSVSAVGDPSRYSHVSTAGDPRYSHVSTVCDPFKRSTTENHVGNQYHHSSHRSSQLATQLSSNSLTKLVPGTVKISTPKPKGPLESRQCGICHKILRDKYKLKTHIEDMHSTNQHIFTCPVCQKVYKTRNTLSNHISLSHRGHHSRQHPNREYIQQQQDRQNQLNTQPGV